MAIKKTEVLLQRPKTQPDLQDPQILIDTKQLQVVNKFKYLRAAVISTTKQTSAMNCLSEFKEQLHLDIFRETLSESL